MKALPGIMPIEMKNGGFYDEHSQSQRAIINMTLPYVEKAVSVVPLPQEKEPFVMVDYGCSEGNNSVQVVNAVLETVRRRQQGQLFSIVFNDLPHNNFNKLFENIYQLKNNDRSSVLAFASGQPFHLQVMPASTVHFGYSSSAAHWLTQLPGRAVRSHIYLAGASENEKNKLSEIAATDWHNFLSARAAEMRPGARLVVTMGACLTEKANNDALLKKIGDADGRIFSSAKGPEETYTAQIMMNLINDIVQELVQEKKISQQQAEAICFPIYPRNLDEVVAPIAETQLREEFILEQAQIVQIACPLFSQFLQTGDSEKYAQLLTEVFKAFMETILFHQLYGIKERRRSARLELAGQKIIDELFDRVQARINAQPEHYTFFPIQSLLILTRK